MEKKTRLILAAVIVVTIVVVGALLFFVVFNAPGKVELIEFSISTWDWDTDPQTKLAEDIVYSEAADYYVINGSIRIIEEGNCNLITTEIKFYDKNNTYLDSEIERFGKSTDVHFPEVHKFSFSYSRSREYFKDVDHIEIQVTISYDNSFIFL